MTILSNFAFDWCSDYGQFMLTDVETRFAFLEDISDTVYARGYHVAPGGLLVYTQDCLRQRIEVALLDSAPPPPEPDSVTPTQKFRTAQTSTSFPSGFFTIGSVSKTNYEAYGPRWNVGTSALSIRISWTEFLTDTYNPQRPEVDCFRLDLWSVAGP